jgi:hypothetical protein
MVEYRPYVPISHGLRVGTAILSYNGNLFFGITGDYETMPDVGVLATAVASEIEDLRECAVVQLAKVRSKVRSNGRANERANGKLATDVTARRSDDKSAHGTNGSRSSKPPKPRVPQPVTAGHHSMRKP